MKIFIIGAVILLMFAGCSTKTESTVDTTVDSLKVDTVIKASVDSTVILTADTTK